MAQDENANAYKVPEYYDYNIYSHYDIENDMVKYRLKQPSSIKKWNFWLANQSLYFILIFCQRDLWIKN